MPMPFPAPRRSTRVLAALLVLSLTLMGVMGSLAVCQVAGPVAKTKTETAADPLLTLNNTSRMLYTLAKQNALASSGPVMIVVGDDLVLRNGEKRIQARVIPEIYHTLKTFDHLALAIDVTLAAAGDGGPIAEDVVRELREYRALLPPARERIASSGLDAEQRERQKAIVDACGEFLDSILEQRTCTDARRIHFMRRMSPLVMANSSAAARARLDALQHQIVAWSKSGDLTPQVLSRLTVLVIGRRLPRKDNLAVQYFSRLLGQHGEGERIIYAEGLGDEPRALDLLATQRVDAQVGVDFFNDPSRMARDLLGDAAREYLPILFDETE